MNLLSMGSVPELDLGSAEQPLLDAPEEPQEDQPGSQAAYPPVSDEEAAKAAMLVDRLFERYDVDQSGTLNTFNELRMFTINLCFKLDLQTTQHEA